MIIAVDESGTNELIIADLSGLDQINGDVDLFIENGDENNINGGAKSTVPSSDSDSRVKSDEVQSGIKPVFVDEISVSAGETAGGDEGILDNCGLIPNNCLPCLASTFQNDEKRRSLSSSPRKKAALKLPFKWKDGHPAAALCE